MSGSSEHAREYRTGTGLALDRDTLEPLQAPLERLFRLHDRILRRWLGTRFPYGGDRVDEAVARTWLIAANHTMQLRHGNARAWLFKVAYREMLHILRDEERHVELLDAHATPDAQLEWVPALVDAFALLDELHPFQQTAIFGKAMGLRRLELAAATGRSATWVNRHLAEGRAALREALAA